MTRSIVAFTLAAVVALGAACGGDSASVGAGAGGGGRATGPREVVLQVVVDGGFVPVSAAVSTVPSVTVFGDGTVVTPAAVAEIYPGPAIAPLQSVRVGAAVVDRLVAGAGELGLLGKELDFGQPPVADVPDTTVTIVAGGVVHRHSANALAEADDLSLGVNGLTNVQRANRRALRQLVDAAHALPPGEEEWQPDGASVFDLGAYRAEPGLSQPALAWPLANVPAAAETGPGGFPCLVVTGADLVPLRAALAKANSLTPWKVPGTGPTRALGFRPVVPGYPGCPK